MLSKCTNYSPRMGQVLLKGDSIFITDYERLKLNLNFLIRLDCGILGSFADLEWLGDICWNMGCILVSDTHAHSMNVFDDILVSASDRFLDTSKEVKKLKIDRYSAHCAFKGIVGHSCLFISWSSPASLNSSIKYCRS